MAKGRYHDWLTEEGLATIKGWAKEGLTDEEIAASIGIASSTFHGWKKRFPDLLEALKSGKEVADFRVEQETYRRAIGYEYEEITFKDGVEVKRVKKHMPADVTAAIFWLKNRQPEKWNDRRQIQNNGTMEIIGALAGLSEGELRSLAEVEKEDQ